ncbi:MAG: DUF6473 family protein [Tabrizicola sp.]|nr:DUF6473 family protein [Tabrizicola sp.]
MPPKAGAGAPGEISCRYGASRATFRGPARDLSRPYVVFLGGSATYGKAVRRPYPDLVEQAIGLTCVNLAAPNAGPDFYLADPGTLQIAAAAQAAVIQVPGAEGLSNPFYTVHNRRNDRFLAATPALRRLFPEVDFTDIHFTRHLLTVLSATDPGRFAQVRKALAATWLSRMELVLDHLPSRRLLLWIGEQAPSGEMTNLNAATTPLFVDDGMLATLQDGVSDTLTAILQCEAPPDRTSPATPSAREAVDRVDHAAIAALLVPRLGGLLSARTAPPLVPRGSQALA